MWTKSWWDGIVQLFMHWCELEMMKIGVLDGRDSLSNQHVVVKCVEWKPSSWIDSTLPCLSVSMLRAGKFGMLANSCKDLDRSGSKRYEKLCAWSFCQRVGDLLVLQLVFPGRVNRNFSYVLSVFLCFPPFFIWGIALNLFYSWGGSPLMSTVLTLASTGG